MDESEDPLMGIFLLNFSRDRNRIYRFIYSLLLNDADADDAFQQCSLILWRKFRDFDQDREFYPWACGVALHAVQNFRRSAKTRHFVLLSDSVIESLADQQMRSSSRSRHRVDLMEECLSLLKSKDLNLVQQVYQDGGSASSVASEIGQAVQTVYNRLNGIRKGLVECVDRKAASSA